jgi:DNA repair exonuclease SbcCD ATPase subunit
MRNYKIAFCLFLFTCASYGQSLGDVAREQRQKQQAKDPKAAAKVVTNDEIPESPDASTNSSDDTTGAPESSTPAASSAGKKTAEQWKSEIEARKTRIAALQSHVEKLNDWVHFVEANGYYNGGQNNQYQLKKQEAQRMQSNWTLRKRRWRCAGVARKAGFGSAVYDPVN